MSDTTTISFHCQPVTRTYLDEAMTAYGCSLPGRFLDMLLLAHHEGRLLLLDRATQEAIVGAAEDRMIAKATRAARDQVHLVLWEEGYRADPYER